MFRIAAVALVLSVSSAQAFAPLVCAPNTNPSEGWLIDGKTISREHGPKLIKHWLQKHIGKDAVWTVILADGDPLPPSTLTIKHRRTMEWITGNARVRGTCRDATRRDLLARQ